MLSVLLFGGCDRSLNSYLLCTLDPQTESVCVTNILLNCLKRWHQCTAYF